MQMNRLRLLGFKSFVESTELIIEKGLTGVVGPNGCGKSNLLEALRWVMGEASHKSMRAAAMDDVIFSGTNTRPARNWAEVTISLDNSARKAPAEYNDADIIEITRRIEREAGSAYRINGRDARARDVKLLFDDAATGSRSPALVRQGQIAELVNAKPDQRRRVLEDAAGVAGLHSRRHEAELRLKAAETNLARLGDIVGQLGSQVDSLKRQARHAKRYKELSEEIRGAEALLFHLTWVEAHAQVEAEEAALLTILSALAVATQAEAAATRAEAEIAERIQPLRDDEATRAAILARLKVEQDNFEAEADRAVVRSRELEARVTQLATDLTREEGLISEATDTLERLTRERALVEAAIARARTQVEQALARLTPAEAKLLASEERLNRLTQTAFESRARRKSIEVALADCAEATEKLRRRIADLETQHRDIAAKAPDAHSLARNQEAGQELMAALGDIETGTIAAEDAVRLTAAEARARRDGAQKARLVASEVRTELSTLASLLVPVRDDDVPPIVDSLSVASGYEIALGAALGDDLDAALSSDSPVYWRRIDPSADDAGLPEGAEPLCNRVKGPPELTRRLRQIGVVGRSAGHRLQPALRVGQRLVSREGDLWRWDGFVAAADAPTAAAQRLAQKNRLADLEAQASDILAAADDAVAGETAAAEAQVLAEAIERRLRQRWRDAQSELARTRASLTVMEKAARETEGRLQVVADARLRAEESLIEIAAKQLELETALAQLEAEKELELQLVTAQNETRLCRTTLSEIKTAMAAAGHEQQTGTERCSAIATEVERWASRRVGAAQQIGSLQTRHTEATAELRGLAVPAELIEDKRQKLINACSSAEAQRRQAADAVAAAETALRVASQTIRAAHAKLSSERESRARIEARLEAARAKRQDQARRIRDALGVPPDECLALAGQAADVALRPLDDVDRQLTKLKSDRERLGGVNLQAGEELLALQAQVAAIDTEKRDVEAAIAKLRGAIGQLNREAKKRLMDAFTLVDGHFRRLFTTLFGGGEARLELIESEDPMEGGLEIIAKPPGKKPATLSLLSGGEQTLTAMSLIFAVFLTNPSPICVLDEVDAPLDDANIERFCTLMEKMATETETRFLIITHHPMTMARTHRLFGVTMGEKGVSQLVSVDLAAAEKFREAG